MTAATSTPALGPRAISRAAATGTIVAIATVAGPAFVTGWAIPILLAIGAVLLGALVFVAITRVEAFALVLLAGRASLDIANMQQRGVQGGVSGLPATLVSVLLIGVVVVWIAANRRQGCACLPWVSLAGVAVAGAAVVSVTASIRPFVTLTEAARLASAIAMLTLLTALIRDDAGIRRVLTVCYGSMVLPLVVALTQAMMGAGGSNVDGVSRIVGTFLHPNAFGAYLTVLLVTGVALVPAVRSRVRWSLVLLLVAGFTTLLLTYSRGSWLATAIGLLVVAIVQRRVAVILLLVAVLGGGSQVPSVQARLADLEQGRSLSGSEGNSLVWRIDYWRETLQYADDSPATGIGLDMAQFVTIEQNLPHNDFVRMYVEAGWLGLLSLLSLLGTLATIAVRAMRAARNSLHQAVAHGFVGSLASLMVMMVGGNIITSVVVLWYFFALAACAYAITVIGDGNRIECSSQREVAVSVGPNGLFTTRPRGSSD